MMYYYWKTKGIRPSVFHSMPRGELKVVRAFYLQELEDRREEMKAFAESGSCPMMFR